MLSSLYESKVDFTISNSETYFLYSILDKNKHSLGQFKLGSSLPSQQSHTPSFNFEVGIIFFKYK